MMFATSSSREISAAANREPRADATSAAGRRPSRMMGTKRGVAPVQYHFSKWVAVLGGCLLVLVFASVSQGVSTSERSPPWDGGGHGSKGGTSGQGSGRRRVCVVR